MGLERYRSMRDFSKTAEPAGKVKARKGFSYLIQKHAASRLHYDLRLELDGVLKSWSVPKGPSYATRDKRLAVEVEDHPVEYGKFEGTIPEGEYGGGTVMLWDRGRWEPIGDPHVGLEKGKLDFVLHGERLRGRWSLVRLRRAERDRGKNSWLFFKRSDEHADPGGEEITVAETTSVASGRTMDEIASATGREKKVWRSHRGDSGEGAESVRVRVRAAARAGRAARGERPRAKVASAAPRSSATLSRAEVPASAARPARSELSSASWLAHAPRKWEVAPREGAYRGPSARRPSSRLLARVPIAGVGISNPARIVDPASGTTKLDLARYFESIAGHFLEHGARRPLALVRCPEGSAGQCFYQKHSHPGMSRSIHVATDPHGEELLSVTTIAGVVSLAQWGAVELHGWGSRVRSLETPDWIVIDLDPGPGIGWSEVVEGALATKERLDRIGLASFVKTTGGKGLHVVIPIAKRHDWDLVKAFSRALALDLVDRAPDRFIATMSKSVREGRIFVDYLRNGRGNTAILPYSPRARDGLPVAMPIAWSEVARIDPLEMRVASVPGILAKRRRDPWAALKATRQSITQKVLANLGA